MIKQYIKKAVFCFLFIFIINFILFAQSDTNTPQKFALVIGNGAYTNLSRLSNPVNDANDMAAILREMGFTVDRVLNANLNQMDNAIIRLKNRLSVSSDSYGFFFYAGHGVQSGGENYLIPVDANIPGENFLRSRALSVQAMLDELNDAGNILNVVVLDACRDNPFGWARSGSRGLAMVSRQPADSIIVYATSAGEQASDGIGRNGLFTSQLLQNLRTPGLEVHEVFRRTGADVSEASNRRQIPAVYNQFFGIAYLGSRPVTRPPVVFESGAASIATGKLLINTITAGTISITGADINEITELPAWGSLPIERINSGTYQVVMRYNDGRTEERRVEIGRLQEVVLDFSYRPVPLPEPRQPRPPREPKPPKEPKPVTEKQPVNSADTRLNSIGMTLGSSFSAPWLIVTLHGSIAPSNYTFFDLGLDIGTRSGDLQTDHFSLCPFIRYSLFLPFNAGGGWYVGIGTGFLYAKYNYPDVGEISDTFLMADISSGFVFKNGINVSYTFRTDFEYVYNKVTFGYLYRFQGK